MATDWSQYVTNALSSMNLHRPGSIDFGNKALANVQAGRQRKHAREIQQAQSADAAARLAFDKEKFEYEQEESKRDFDAKQATEKTKKGVAIAKELKGAEEDVASGHPGRIGALGSRVKALGGDMRKTVRGEPEERTVEEGGSYALPDVPDVGLTAPGDLGPGQALERSETLTGGYAGANPYSQRKTELGEAGARSAAPGLDVPHPTLAQEFMPAAEGELSIDAMGPVDEWDYVDSFEEVPDKIHVVPSTERDVYEIFDQDGKSLGQLDQKALWDEGIVGVSKAMEELVSRYAPEYPVESEAIQAFTTEAFKSFMQSPGTTRAEALEYVSDMFLDLIKSRQDIDAARAAHGLPEIDPQNMRLGFSTFAEKDAKDTGALATKKSLETSSNALPYFLGTNEDGSDGLLFKAANGLPMNTIVFFDMLYAVAKNRDPGGRVTDKDFEYTMGEISYSEMFKRWLSGRLPEVNSGTALEKMFASQGVLGKDGTLPPDLVKRVYRYFKESKRRNTERMEQAKPVFRQTYDSLRRGKSNDVAQGYAMRANTIFGDDFLPVLTPEQAHPEMVTPMHGQPPVVRSVPQQKPEPAPAPQGSPEQQNLNNPDEPWNQ